MNMALTSLYEKLATENKQGFLNNNILPDTNWGKHIKGITLQIDLSEEVRDQIGQYEKELDTLESDNFLFLPREYQHISFRQVVYWNDTYKEGHDTLWKHISDEFLDAFYKLDKRFTTFPLFFYRLIPMREAVIYCAYDETNEMNILRETMYSLLPFPKETTKINTLIHTTVARYKHTLNNPNRVFDYVEKQSKPIRMYPTAIVLRREHIFPSIGTTELARITLK